MKYDLYLNHVFLGTVNQTRRVVGTPLDGYQPADHAERFANALQYAVDQSARGVRAIPQGKTKKRDSMSLLGIGGKQKKCQ